VFHAVHANLILCQRVGMAGQCHKISKQKSERVRQRSALRKLKYKVIMSRVKKIARKSTGGNDPSEILEDPSLTQIKSVMIKHLLYEDLSFLVEHVHKLTVENVAEVTRVDFSLDLTSEYVKHEMNGISKLTQFLMQVWMLKENENKCIVLVGNERKGGCDVVRVKITDFSDIPFFYEITQVQRSYTELHYVFDSLPYVYAKGNAEIVCEMVDCSLNRKFFTYMPVNTGKLYLRPRRIVCKSAASRKSRPFKISEVSVVDGTATEKSSLEQIKSVMIDHLQSEDLPFLVDFVSDLTLENIVDVAKVDLGLDIKSEQIEDEMNGILKVTQFLMQKWLLKENQSHCVVLVRRHDDGGCLVMKAKPGVPLNPDWDDIVKTQCSYTELGYVFPQIPTSFIHGGCETLCEMVDCSCNRKFLTYLPFDLKALYGSTPTFDGSIQVYYG
jgi:hypothetical protein